MTTSIYDITCLIKKRDSVLRALEHIKDGYACLTIHPEVFVLDNPEARGFAEKFLRIRLSAIEDTMKGLGVDVEERDTA